jgi:hypothetical protein
MQFTDQYMPATALPVIADSRVDNQQSDSEQGRGDERQLGKEELHLGVGSMISKEDFLHCLRFLVSGQTIS